MPIPIASSTISFQRDFKNVPLVDYRLMDFDAGRFRRQLHHFEYYWGLQKGEASLESSLNHIQLRSDMAASMDLRQWTLMPTKETLETVLALSEHNRTQEGHARRRYTEDLPETEYEYEFVPLFTQQEQSTLYVNNGLATRAVRAPYTRMPRIKSRAHPLFVIFRSHQILMLFLYATGSKEEQLALTVSEIIYAWTEPPPPEFFVDRDLWKAHRHPLSDDGSVVHEAIYAAKTCRTRKGQPPVRKSTKAPCPQPKRRSPRHVVYERILRSSPTLSIAGSSNSSDDDSFYVPDPREWIETVNSEKNSTCDTPIDVVNDRQLAAYRKENARDAKNVLRLHDTHDRRGIIIGAGDDHSGYTSNDWARYKYGTCLSSSKQPVRPAGPLDPACPWL
ncbi:hypothetical protein BD626DRAFT_402240 [Schizophyllum amplum]|uniref:HNH nuclease domain-containing protein n=1 Tax=Schizophyllum amplum TaxID=97359 RepID=A0A550CF65_9AGAR|nr:hypothetical protein BD626DRAFT_402240 [Auriculariopsis ampla]